MKPSRYQVRYQFSNGKGEWTEEIETEMTLEELTKFVSVHSCLVWKPTYNVHMRMDFNMIPLKFEE